MWLMPDSSPRYSSMLTSSVAIVSIHMAAKTKPSAAMTAEPTGKPRPNFQACNPAIHPLLPMVDYALLHKF